MPPASVAVPALLLGLVIAGYWYRVLRMAARARRRTGRAGNLVPREPLGRALRVLWFPAIGLWVAHPFVIAFDGRPPAPFELLLRSVPSMWIGATIAAACFAATRVCWDRMGSSWRMGIDPDERTPLVATGPFGYVRHPIYALSVLMMLATMLALPSPLMLTAGFVHIGLLFWESTREERHLLRVHGKTYEAYRARVGRFIPMSSRPYVSPAQGVAARGAEA